MASVRGRPIAREPNEIGLQNFIEALRSLLVEVQHLHAHELDAYYLEESIEHMEDAIGTLQLLANNDVLRYDETDDRVLQDFRTITQTVLRYCREINRLLHTLLEAAPEVHHTAFECQTVVAGRGRPFILVHREQIEFLHEVHFSWVKIASILGITESTLRRRRAELCIDDDQQDWSQMSGNRLGIIILLYI